jgi:hypothetical protein
MRPIFCLIMALMVAISAFSSSAQSPQKWVTSWTGSVQGPYPIGNPSAQPDLRFAFPSPEIGARDQSFRLIVRPDLWGRQVRLRFSNALGTRPVTFDGELITKLRSDPAAVRVQFETGTPRMTDQQAAETVAAWRANYSRYDEELAKLMEARLVAALTADGYAVPPRPAKDLLRELKLRQLR